MTPDHYATLGLAPSTEDAVIRAAYLALMRRYHPDTNPSAAAAEKVRSITSAYEVLGDPERRADYDWSRAVERQPMRTSHTGSWRGRQTAVTLFGATALMALTVFLVMPPVPVERDRHAQSAQKQQQQPSPSDASADPVAASERKEAKFAQRTVPPANLPLAVAEAPRGIQAVAAATPGGTRPVAVEAIRSQRPVAVEAAPKPAARPAPPAAVSLAAVVPARAARAVPAATAPKPKPARCGSAPSRAAAAICSDTQVAALNRHLSILLNQSQIHSNASKRTALFRNQEKFTAGLEKCTSDACIREVYLNRIREVGAIAAGPAQPR